MTGKDRKAFDEAVTQAHEMGLMLCLIYNPAFNHFYVEMKTPDTREPMGQAMGPTVFDAALACCLDAKRRMNILGLEKYQFEETKPLVLQP